MIVSIRGKNHTYKITLERITQWCGRSISHKSFVIDSFCKYFSTQKYAEYEDMYADNIRIDNEIIGRKYIKVILINDRNSLIQSIKGVKNGLVLQLIKEEINRFDYQRELEVIDDSLLRIYESLNRDLLSNLGNISIDYEHEDLLYIISQSSFRQKTGDFVEKLDNTELLDIFLGAFAKVQECVPDKTLVIFNNIDHLLSVTEYKDFVSDCERVSRGTDSWFVFVTSLDGYAVVDEEKCEGITVFNDVEFSMPDYEHIRDFVEQNYPYLKNWKPGMISELIQECVHNLGREDALISVESLVVQKMINESLGIKNRLEKKENEIVFAYLMA